MLHERANLGLALERMRARRYEDALASIRRSREWPEHLGAGKPYDPDERLQDYLENQCEARLGRRAATSGVSAEKLQQEYKSTIPWKYDLLPALSPVR
jgi:hypothetical protein